ncbi:MAG: sigma-54-dependent Fis family transcriptional regulator [Deltaproteobacteria bacterium]|nr:sigma-54-dependent Fis family transcriptional regulator [Deltaproteobacteria bacterium]
MGRLVLVVDDDALVRSLMVGILRQEGHQVDEAQNGRDALARIAAAGYDLVLTDLKMPDLSGLELLQQGRRLRPEARWILITAFGSIPNAVEAMKAGASDYLTKPLKSPDELRRVVGRVLREVDAESRIALLSEELGRQFPPLETIFLGETMQAVRVLVQEVAPTPATVLLTGASGTGKELVARVIHELSPRKDKPFVAVHCAALAESVLESELFGHEKGSFTGATGTRKGRFELADGGTLLLDEIGEIAPSVQVKLLRVLQERQFERVGGNRPLSVDVRVIAATNRDLKAEIAAGRFREDLFYRLHVFPIALPGLADRPDAIEPLAEHLARKASVALGRPLPRFTPDALDALRGYSWPGNVRELQNVVERAVILSAGEIEPRHLSLEPCLRDPLGGEDQDKARERQAIEKALAQVRGHRERAAALLGISRRTLQYRIKEYGL